MPDIADHTSSEMEFLENILMQQHNRQKGVSAHFCEACGHPIPEARRIAVPGVRQCRDCQELEEKLEQARQRTGRTEPFC